MDQSKSMVKIGEVFVDRITPMGRLSNKQLKKWVYSHILTEKQFAFLEKKTWNLRWSQQKKSTVEIFVHEYYLRDGKDTYGYLIFD